MAKLEAYLDKLDDVRAGYVFLALFGAALITSSMGIYVAVQQNYANHQKTENMNVYEAPLRASPSLNANTIDDKVQK